MQTARFVVWDLGGTKCATAIVDYAEHQFTIHKHYECNLRDFVSLAALTESIEQYFNMPIKEADAVCIAGAGQYNGNELFLDKGPSKQGYPYPIYLADLAKRYGWRNFNVVHDYTPIVCRSFLQEDTDIETIHEGEFQPYGRRVALGIGTGLGMKDAIRLPNNHIWLGANEIGHIGLAHPPVYQMSEFTQHLEIINFMQQHDQHGMLPITFESVLSGSGLALLHQYAMQLAYPLSPEETAMDIDQNPNSITLQLFAKYLGLFIGVVQLAFMPSAGIWIAGGVIQKHQNLFREPLLSHLKRGIALSPAYKKERENFPIKFMRGTNHAFLGGAYFLVQKLNNQIWS